MRESACAPNENAGEAVADGGVVDLGDEQLASSHPLIRSRRAAGVKGERNGNSMRSERDKQVKRGGTGPATTRGVVVGWFAAGVVQGL